MDEGELRQLAREARAALGTILDGDDETAARLATAIDAALALPAGTAKRALRRVMMSDPRLHAWVRARTAAPAWGDRLAWNLPGTEPREEIREGGDRDFDPGPAAPESVAPRPRHLLARMPDRAETGRRISLLVAVTVAPGDGTSSVLKDLVVPPEGATVTVLVSASGLAVRGDREADVLVPAEADSDPVRFVLDAGPVGLHTVTVEAFRGGTYLGAVTLKVSVENDVATTEEREHVAPITSVDPEPGEVTLRVSQADGVYRFQMLGNPWYAEVTTRLGDVDREIAALTAALRDMAAKESPFTAPQAARRRVRQLGINLWRAALPPAVQEQFWEQADRISMFTVAAENDAIPWELLYPRSGTADDMGFLVEQFPLVRRVYGAPRTATLGLGSVAYVVPPRSPANALEEVAAVRQRLGPGVVDRGVVAELSAMDGLVLDSPGVLHFACHNTFTDEAGSSIALDGGPWAPVDLSDAGVGRSMAAVSPLVFLNACRSAGESHWFSAMSGWAQAFVDAGAGAFIGTLWAVRSSAARTFADAFYQQFVDEGQPLGRASLRARQAIADDGGDPTWLAYSVYGNPAAVAATERTTA